MIVMTIAGIDPSAGAGVYADLKTFQSHGVYGAGIVTALTAQNPKKVDSVLPVSADFVEKQIDTVLEEYKIEYVKTGMLYSPEIIKLVGRKIKEYDLKAVVDPVMVASSGGKLTQDDLADALNKYLLSKAILTTPNVSEAEKLTGMKIKSVDDAKKASNKLACDNVITGGHLDGIDTININGNISLNRQELIETTNLHGTGCVFSSSITANIAKGSEIHEAIRKASDFVHEAIINGAYGTLR